MKVLKFLTIFLLLSNLSISFAQDQENQLKNKIAKNLRCLICQGQSVYDSDSEFAMSLKILIKNKIDKGFSEKKIYEHLENKYGEWILYDPKFNKNTYFLWILPLLIFILGGLIILKLFIKKKN